MKPASAQLADATQALRAAGIDDPVGDARRLLADALAAPRGRLVLYLPEEMSKAAAARFEAHVAERLKRRPVSQILGRREFFGREFRITSDVLDPRPETELLVELALARRGMRILDIGTGSGAILISVLAGRAEATGLGTDVSPAALAVARENARRAGVAERAAFRHADWWQGVEGTFDLILSNPPYIARDEIPCLAPEVREWEPLGALAAGSDGLDACRAIIVDAMHHLAPGGSLIVEHGHRQEAAVRQLFRAAGFQEITGHRDMDGRDRAVMGHRPG